MANLNLSKQDVDYIARVVATEVPSSIKQRDPQTYRQMVQAVTDTILNRVASDQFPDTVKGVVDQNLQFSKIAGPTSYRDRRGRWHRLNPYGTVEKAPKAAEDLQEVVEDHVVNRSQGAPSIVGGALHYANPNFSSRNNLGWINSLGGPRLGIGQSVHYHGTAPGFTPAGDYEIALEGIQTLPDTAPIPTPAPDRTYAAPAGVVDRAPLAPVEIPDTPVASIAEPGTRAENLQASPVGDVARGALPPARDREPALAAFTDPSSAEVSPIEAIERLALSPAYAGPEMTPAKTGVTPPAVSPRMAAPYSDPRVADIAPVDEVAITAPAGRRNVYPDGQLATISEPHIAGVEIGPEQPTPAGMVDPSAMPAVSDFAETQPPGGVAPPPDPLAAMSTMRPDNLNYAGPKGLGGQGGIYVGGVPGEVMAGDLTAPLDPNADLMPQGDFTPAPPLSAPIEVATEEYPVVSPQEQVREAQQRASEVPGGMHAISGLFGAPEGALAVSRSNPDISFRSLGNGRVEKTNQFGVTSILGPGDYSHPSVPGDRPSEYPMDPNDALDGGLSGKNKGGLSKKDDENRFPSIKEIAGALAGAAIGSYVAGPIGAAVGSRVGKSVGNRGFGGTLGHVQGNLMNSPLGRALGIDTVSYDTSSGRMTAARPTSGGPFPSAPSAPSRRDSSPSRSRDDLSQSARDAVSSGRGGLY